MCFVARFQLWAHMPFVKWVRGCLDRNSTTRYHKPRFGRMANIEDSITPCAHAITLIHLCRPDLAPIVAHIFPGIVCGLVACSAKTLGLSDVDTISASLYQDDTWSHHQMETFSALLALCAGNSKGQWMRNFDAFFRALSHTWVRYPGFSGHGVKCPILTTVVPGFSGDLIGCTIRSKWSPFGDLYLARKKKLLCVK